MISEDEKERLVAMNTASLLNRVKEHIIQSNSSFNQSNQEFDWLI